MPIIFGRTNTVIDKVVYNNTDLEYVYYNQKLVFCKSFIVSNVDYIEIELYSCKLRINNTAYTTKSDLRSHNASYTISGTTVTVQVSRGTSSTSLELDGYVCAVLKDGRRVALGEYNNNNLNPRITIAISNMQGKNSVTFDLQGGAVSSSINESQTREVTPINSVTRSDLYITARQNNQTVRATYAYSAAKINGVSKNIVIKDSIPA